MEENGDSICFHKGNQTQAFSHGASHQNNNFSNKFADRPKTFINWNIILKKIGEKIQAPSFPEMFSNFYHNWWEWPGLQSVSFIVHVKADRISFFLSLAYQIIWMRLKNPKRNITIIQLKTFNKLIFLIKRKIIFFLLFKIK
jgi:hypothetical protein